MVVLCNIVRAIVVMVKYFMGMHTCTLLRRTQCDHVCGSAMCEECV